MQENLAVNIFEVKNRDFMLIDRLTDIWESSVRATHLFLSEPEIEEIKCCVPDALRSVGHLIAAEISGYDVAFMGIDGNRLEMLFVLPQQRGKGLGKQLLKYAVENHAVNELTVNEQNPLARGFYEHMGFCVYKRTETDEQGKPYPLLYMKLN